MKRFIKIIMVMILFLSVSCSDNPPEHTQDSTQALAAIENSNDRDLVNAYTEAIKRLIREDIALNHGTSFYAVEIDTFKGIYDAEIDEIRELIESMGKDFQSATMQELKVAGEFDEDTMALKRSILIRVDEIIEYTEKSFKFTASKTRSSLGAIGMTFEFVRTDDGWEFIRTSGYWIS